MKKEKQQKIVDTIIGQGTVIEGKIKHPSSLRIDGKIYGEVDCAGDVFIGKDGYVEPTIKGKNIIIAGEVNGDLYTSEKVHVQPSGKLSGSATTKGIIIDDGGTFNGESTIKNNDNKASEKKKKKQDEEAS
ncbi:protein CcmA, bactofilin family [Virgibacillus subterraneus]|uniref:Protein CcmA, bactofilin family n=3 Tax=Virgibacillus TaxID=84406 RepID=A0A1H0XXC7_9BACI|nr:MULTISPECIES: polymer-forming cytoskeletal protein [Virgibacillus]MBP1949304.1 cytoskeletal protein CcmA (bactofilin family) [Virgibacillus litoralis]SDQ07559.1 protein CcmA, bactofilin family [Virgibacillus salinus]SEP62940.1 protein CcmA, bactofilin family [Virgibacillus subterraneus]